MQMKHAKATTIGLQIDVAVNVIAATSITNK